MMKKSRILLLMMVLALCFACAGCAPTEPGTPEAACEYEGKLFTSDRVHTVDVSIAGADWEDLKARPMEKTKYSADVTIDGETFRNVSFATKGNSSLAAVAADPDSCRYSFKINFGKYDKDQTYYGLNKLHLNNTFGDATYMKDYFSYELFRQAGVSAPLISYVWLTVNGEPVGLYIAVEDVSESFRARALNGQGELYKPETVTVENADIQYELLTEEDAETGAAASAEAPSSETLSSEAAPSGTEPSETAPPGTVPPGTVPPGEKPDGTPPPGGKPEGQPGFSCKGADLVYIDDSTASYPDIFEHSQTKAAEEDMQRVVSALKGFPERRNPAEYLDTAEIIRYFAAHNFVLNGDSYTGVVPTNYILYEKNGKLSMLPWDYNLAFGGFPAGNPNGAPTGNPGAAPAGFAGSIPDGAPDDFVQIMPGDMQNTQPMEPTSEELGILLNTGIDSPLNGIPDQGRPMWFWILSSDAFRNQYHDALRSLVAGYFESGEFDRRIDALQQMLLPYVEQDPMAFYTAEEFTRGCEEFRKFCRIRSQSVRAQVDGKLSCYSMSQKAEDRIDASDIDLQSLGTPLHDTPAAQ